MPTRHPDTVRYLDKVFNLSVYDLDTLNLCHRDYKRGKFGLTDAQAKESRARMDSVTHLLKQSMIEFDPTNQCWELRDSGNTVLKVIQLLD